MPLFAKGTGENKKIKVHHGFLSYAYNALHIIFSNDILSAMPQMVLLYGASQGSAVALIMAVLLKLRYPKLTITAATYGGPAVGNRALYEYLVNIEVYRRYWLFDLVVHAPYWLVGLWQ